MQQAEKNEAQADAQHTAFAVMYVNELARPAMMTTEAKPAFSVGSIIVREKLTGSESATPELLTVMVKRAKGFNPDASDWEFIVLNGAATETRLRQKVGNCQACHISQKDTDFVFRTYLNEAK
ncbi:MAG: cytochrome P460 family protein [Pyrinomonadaceae bacterium]|nr:cytochrome P460 family protein [Pyrinomonadaceae bacterium]